MFKVDYERRKNSPTERQLAFRTFWDPTHPDNIVIDNSYWIPGRVLVEYYLRDNPSQIQFRLFDSNKEFGFWIESSFNRNNVRMLTIKREILYPHETQDACSIYKRKDILL